jgi:hypothetical protein
LVVVTDSVTVPTTVLDVVAVGGLPRPRPRRMPASKTRMKTRPRIHARLFNPPEDSSLPWARTSTVATNTKESVSL